MVRMTILQKYYNYLKKLRNTAVISSHYQLDLHLYYEAWYVERARRQLGLNLNHSWLGKLFNLFKTQFLYCKMKKVITVFSVLLG